MVLVQSRRQKPICDPCNSRKDNVDLNQEIKDPEMKKFFDIDEKLYEQSYFLRDIKKNYILNEVLTEKQISAFEKVVKDITEENETKDE